MKNILVVGSAGQIGSELIIELRKRYGKNHVVASDISVGRLKDLYDDGPLEVIDVTNKQHIGNVVIKYKIDTIYNLAAILSAIGETSPMLAWNIGIGGLLNCLEVAREVGCAVFTPSSIGAFGGGTPLDQTPQDTIMRPETIYGISKVTGELLSDYYFKKYGVDTRSVRFPGIISSMTKPGGGTTDYAVEIYYDAFEHHTFECPLAPGTFLDMMYMPDAVNAAIELMEADPEKLVHRNAFNITAMSFDPETLAAEIRKHIPDFSITYKVDPLKQRIADSWPNSLDDTCARNEWGWNPKWNLQTMTTDMLRAIGEKSEKGFLF